MRPGHIPARQWPTGYALKGHYAGRSPKCFSFAGGNLARKYGPDWQRTYPEVIHRRLRSWGLNTIGNWSDETTRLLRRTPYTDAVSSHGAKSIEGSEGYWGRFRLRGERAPLDDRQEGQERRRPVVPRLLFRQRNVLGR